MHDIWLLPFRGVHRPTDETHPYHALSGQKAAAQTKSVHAATHGSRPKSNGVGHERYTPLHLVVYVLHSCQALPMLITGILHCVCRGQEIEQELIYEKLPADIADRHVLLMDPILATGNSAARAIQVSLSFTQGPIRVAAVNLLLACRCCLQRA